MVYFDIAGISLLQSILFAMDKKFQKRKYAAVVDLILYICTHLNWIWDTINFRDIIPNLIWNLWSHYSCLVGYTNFSAVHRIDSWWICISYWETEMVKEQYLESNRFMYTCMKFHFSLSKSIPNNNRQHGLGLGLMKKIHCIL